jgi:hypothetical protein
MLKVLLTLHLAKFEPTIFCSVGGDDDHLTTPPGHKKFLEMYQDRLHLGKLEIQLMTACSFVACHVIYKSLPSLVNMQA